MRHNIRIAIVKKGQDLKKGNILKMLSAHWLSWLSIELIHASTGINMHALNVADIWYLNDNDDFYHFSMWISCANDI